MSQKKYRVAIIGLGRIGAQLEDDPLREKPCTHLGAWAANPRCEIVGVCDTIPQLIRYAGSLAKLPPDGQNHFGYTGCYSDYQKMLTEVKADIVSIATPDETHRKISRDAMGYENVKLIWLEKPIATTASEADDIISRAREFKVKVAINHTRRWHPVWQHAAKLCAEKPPMEMVGYFGGDVIREGSHMADLFQWFSPLHYTIVHQALDYLIFEVDLLWQDKRVRISENGRVSEMFQVFNSVNYDSHIKELQKTCEVRKNLYPESPMLSAAKQLVDCLDHDEDPYCDAASGKKALELALSWK